MSSIHFPIMLTFAIIGIIIQCAFIYIESKKDYIKAVILKGSASLCFLTTGIVGFAASSNKVFSSLILAGLILGVIGDILLNLRFVLKNKSQLVFLIGTISFLFGHIFYIIALFLVSKANMLYIPIIMALAITFIVGYFIFKLLKVKNELKIFGCAYILIVSLFMSIATYNLSAIVNNQTILAAVGSILFFLSDVILIFNSFGPNPKLYFRASNLILYFLGQILIGFCLLF